MIPPMGTGTRGGEEGRPPDAPVDRSETPPFPPPEPLPPARSDRFPAYFRALRHRNFRLFWFGQMISLVGSWMQSAAQWWLVHRLTDEPIWLGIVGTASFLPVFLFSFVGGVVADRFPKRGLIIGTQVASMTLAAVLAFLTLTGIVNVYQIVVLAFLLGTVMALDMPARQSFVIEMVGEKDLLNAVALNSSVFNGARVVGPAVAGLVIAAVGEGTCFVINAVSFLPVIAGLVMMRLPPPAKRERSALARELTEGFRFVKGMPRIRTVLIAAAFASIFGMSNQILLPIFADKILGRGPEAYGLLLGALGLGAVAGAVRLAGRTETTGSARRIALGLGLFGAALAAFSFSGSFLLSWILLLIGGAAMITQLATTNSLLQRLSPDGIRGRVLSIYTFTLVGLAPIGSFLAGALAQRIGAPWAMRIGGFACLAGALWFASRIPRFRAALLPRVQPGR